MGQEKTSLKEQIISFDGINLNGLMLAIQLQLNGMPVSIYIESELQPTRFREVTRLFPLRKRKLFEVQKDLEFFHEVAVCCPSLFLPRRIAEFAESIPGKAFVFLADSYLKNDHENASYVMKPSETKGFEDFDWFAKGLLTREFAYDRFRLMVELLKYFRTIGGEVVEGKAPEDVRFVCIADQTDDCFYPVKQKINYPSDLLVHGEDGSFSIQTENGERYLQVQGVVGDEMKRMIRIITGVDNVSEGSSESKRGGVENNVPLELIRRSIDALLQSLAIEFNQKFDMKPMAKKEIPLSDIFRMCSIDRENCYDMAKESGIQYQQFIEYFHKYGKDGVDQIIEIIYSLMGSCRETTLLWKLAEEQYLSQEYDYIFNRSDELLIE